MALFTFPPKLPKADPDMEMFLGDKQVAPIKRLRRTLPAEWFPQSGVQLTWPHAGTDWRDCLPEITETYVRLAFEIATREPLLIVAPETDSIRGLLESRLPLRATENIRYFACPTDDTWARDHGFLSVVGTGGVELLDFRFNGWGGKFEAAQDNAINRRLFDAGIVRGTYADHLDFELEGGSIESDGQGTLLTTACCVQNANRNALPEAQLTLRLQEALGADRVLYLHHGHLEGDDTDGHIDTLARFCPDNGLAYVQCTDPTDTHFEALQAMEAELKTLRNAEGNPYELVPLPMAKACYDADGERLPATYANFLILNRAVLYPTYADPTNDAKARAALAQLFPKYDLVGIDSLPLIRQHGSIHCATMQFPKGVLQMS